MDKLMVDKVDPQPESSSGAKSGDLKISDLSHEIQPDGGLYCLGWYLNWNKGENHVTMDGLFSAADLRAIAAHMEKHK
jgi:hypothetical protein